MPSRWPSVDLSSSRQSKPGVVLSLAETGGVLILDAQRGILCPTFADLHTHIDKGHTCERSRNPMGSLSGADASTAQASQPPL